MSPSSLAPFISRDDLGDALGENLLSSDSALACVDAACDIVRNEAEQTFNFVEDDTVKLDGCGTATLLLPERPVSEVTAVLVEGEATDDWIVTAQGVLVRASVNGTTTVLQWPMGRQNVEVTYTHGYEDADFPRDVRRVALRIAIREFRQTGISGISSQSETLGSYSTSTSYVTTQASGQDLVTPGEKAALRKYKQCRSF